MMAIFKLRLVFITFFREKVAGRRAHYGIADLYFCTWRLYAVRIVCIEYV